MNPTLQLRLAAITGFLGVALGAFGAHALKGNLEAQGTLHLWQTAVLYHLVHAVAMTTAPARAQKSWSPARLFLIGILLFSGSLYIMALTEFKRLGMVTPLGGLFFLAGWLRMAVAPADESKE